MLKYTDRSYDRKVQMWIEWAKDDERIKVKLDQHAHRLQTMLHSYGVENKSFYIELADCYDLLLHNGGYLQYIDRKYRVDLKLIKSGLMPVITEEHHSAFVNLDTMREVENVVDCWPIMPSFVETFFCNEALMMWGHEIRMPFNQAGALGTELIKSLSELLGKLTFMPTKISIG